MGKWMDLAAQLEAEAGSCDNSDNSAKNAPNGTNGAKVTGLLPPPIIAGLERLQVMPAPSVTRPEVWPAVVADALRIAAEGWAATALKVGWEAVHLFGCLPDGGWGDEALAVWLNGRSIDSLTADYAAANVGNVWSWFTPRDVPGRVYLWDLEGAAGGGI